MSSASQEDHAYFARVREQSKRLESESVPQTLAEMFDRLERIRAAHGQLAQPGMAAREPADGDLPSHLAYLHRLRLRNGRGKNRA
jgi:hypothetical protein